MWSYKQTVQLSCKCVAKPFFSLMSKSLGHFSRYLSVLKIVFVNNILHRENQFHCSHHILLPMIFLLVGIILLTPILCATISIATVSLSVF